MTWGRPSTDNVEALRAASASIRHLAPQFDLVTDGRRVEAVDAEALAALLAWLQEEGDELRSRVREQIGIPPPGPTGVTLAGILPIVGHTHPFRIVTDAEEAYRLAYPNDGAALFAELEGAVAAVLGVSPELVALRELLRAQAGDIDAATAAARLHLSARSLQRALAKVGTSFREEQHAARYRVACELLRETDLKVSAVAARLGVSERALTSLFRSRGAVTPAELRRRAG